MFKKILLFLECRDVPISDIANSALEMLCFVLESKSSKPHPILSTKSKLL